MIQVMYRKKILNIKQVWYPRTSAITEMLSETSKEDILFVHGVPKEEGIGFWRYEKEYHTCRNHLVLTEEEMLANINKAVKYQFRRSEKDDIEIKFYTKEDIVANPSLMEQFSDVYKRMYQSKGTDTKLNITAIEKYLEADAILFTAVVYRGEILVFHSYIRDEQEARLLHSASCFREESADQSMIGRANKRLHWEDIKYFKNAGLEYYDWGGISDFENPNGIDEFKLKFGGDKITYYNIFVGVSLLGKIAVLAMKLLKK